MYQKEAPNLIAEIGVNFDTVEKAKVMIEKSADAGANFVKFQLYNKDTIKDLPKNLRDRLTKMLLTEEKIKELKKHANKNKLDFIMTPMYPEAIDIAAKYCDGFIKIRYADHEKMDMITKALKTGQQLFISVPNIPIEPFLMYHPNIRWLYCLPSYPPKVEEFNLDVAAVCHGLSSHFPHTLCDIAYIIHRSFQECFIEKHVIITRNWDSLGYEKPVDADASITIDQLKEFKNWIDIAEKIQRFKL